MASVRKRLWTAPSGEEKQAWIVDYRDGAGNRRFKQFARKRDADAWLTTAAWQVSQGTHTADSQSITVEQACEIWIAKAEARGRERGTIIQYRQLADLHIKPLLGAQKLSRLTSPDVENYAVSLLQTRSADMTHKAVRALSRILGEAQRRGLVAQNVARDVKVDRSDRDAGKVEIPTKAELRALVEHAEGDMRPFVMTAIMTGLRVSELRGLTWADVDFAAATISVRQRADKYRVIGPPKSKAGRRTVPIGSALVKLLKEWKLACPKGDLVFPNSAGEVQDYGNLLRRKFFPLQIKAGVCDPVLVDRKLKLDAKGNPVMAPRYGIHALRHACASAWIKQGVDLKRLTTWLGHSSVQMSIDVYGSLLKDPKVDAKIANAAMAELFG